MNQSPAAMAFSPEMQAAYSSVHGWLDTRAKANGFRKREPDEEKEQDSLRWKAAHLHFRFPTHYFKVLHVLDHILEPSRVESWIGQGGHVCFVDVGCGAGAASAAYVAHAHQLLKGGLVRGRPRLHCVGIDRSKHAIALYERMMSELSFQVSGWLEVTHEPVRMALSETGGDLVGTLRERQRQWHCPAIPTVVIAQVNVMRPFWSGLESRRREANEARALGLDPDHVLSCGHGTFGYPEVTTYAELFRDLAIDVMPIVTIVSTEKQEWSLLVDEMSCTIGNLLSRDCVVDEHGKSRFDYEFHNPEHSHYYYRPGGLTPHTASGYYHAVEVRRDASHLDTDWDAVVNRENLLLAWARSRRHLLREALTDEAEIRLFDLNLDANIERLQSELAAYAEEVTRTSDRLSYWVPKDSERARPRVLTRLEEEVLSAAVIQTLGKHYQIGGVSYAYRLSNKRWHDKEYLYDYWLESYKEFLEAVNAAAEKHKTGRVLRVDLAAFFTTIDQQSLVPLAAKAMHADSDRVKWLLRCLLLRDMDPGAHELGCGVSQGGIGSGFFANIYLRDIDEHFRPGNAFGLAYFRYVDDMVFVIPCADDEADVLRDLDEMLAKLGLSSNPMKTERESCPEYLAHPDMDGELDSLQAHVDRVAEPLWAMSSEYRRLLHRSRNSTAWWHHVDLYRECLRSVRVYIDSCHLSRRIWQYVIDPRYAASKLSEDQELRLPRDLALGLRVRTSEWATEFLRDNLPWVEDRAALISSLNTSLGDALGVLTSADDTSPQGRRALRRARRRIRFCANRLCMLGLHGVYSQITDLLCNSPWVLSDPRRMLESLADQGYSASVQAVVDHYASPRDPGEQYMLAIAARALRFAPDLSYQRCEQLQSLAADASASDVVRLMASESLLYLAAKGSPPLQELGPSLPSQAAIRDRLKKNLVLLDSVAVGQAPVTTSMSTCDPMLAQARTVAQAGSAREVFRANEPDVLRQYYADVYPTDTDLYDY